MADNEIDPAAMMATGVMRHVTGDTVDATRGHSIGVSSGCDPSATT